MRRVNIPWRSELAAYFPHDRAVRFEYVIQIPNNSGQGLHEFRALCELSRVGEEDRFDGYYRPLTQIEGCGSPNGAISFRAAKDAFEEPALPQESSPIV
jgi:hypothetical protein